MSFSYGHAEADARMRRFLDAAKEVDSPDFRGLVLVSLIAYVDDEMLDEAIDDALRTLEVPRRRGCAGRSQA